ncbi:MAG: glutamate racemase [Alphaproteobacteria bacterium]|nr:glutamate racemase [Alphaproteobacteria bacterium]
MKMGIFDSGLGGLVIAKAFMDKLPQYDYVYYGDSAHLPYGEKTSEQILTYTLDSVRFLIQQQCRLIVLACNTASCVALRYIQQQFIPSYSPNTKVLGVIIPTVEQALLYSHTTVGVVATPATINSDIYGIELKKINPKINVVSVATPALVPAIEQNDFEAAEKYIFGYADSLRNIPSLILGCTHYPLVKELFQKALPQTHIISQDDFMGGKLADYLQRHPEIECDLTKTSTREFFVSQLNPNAKDVAKLIFPNVTLKLQPSS